MICPSCGTAAPADARYCPGCGHALAAGRGDERRLVTVLFADLVGYTALAETRDPEQVKNLVDRCFERLAADVVAYGGRVDKIVGDAIMALFGAPLAHEDDAERAVRAGLQMLRTLADWSDELGVDIRMRVGINSGEVLVGALRAGGDYTAMGDVVNTANRLQAAAAPGQVLVGPTTEAATRDLFRYQSLGLVEARGREEPVPAWAALEAVGPPGHRPRRIRTLLVGRDDEIGLLEHALSLTAERRRAHLVVLTGDAGTGKTRLAEEIATRARRERHAVVLEGRCVPYGESNVWWPLAEALRRACGIEPTDDHDTAKTKGSRAVTTLLGLPADDPELQRVFKGLAYLMDQGEWTDLEPARARDEAVRSMAICLERMTVERPLVFVVSELHWADDPLLEFLDRLLGRVEQLPILMVATARPELADRWHPPAGRHNQLVLHIDPLDAAATARLLEELVAVPPSPEVSRALVERSGGNPLFLEELTALMSAARPVDELPLTLQGLVAARLDGLGLAERATLEDAAVVGRTGSREALEVVASNPRDVDPALAVLVGADLLTLSDAGRDTSTWEFRSELVREVAYGILTKAERARRHAALAAWLESRAGPSPGNKDLDELAHHYGTAGELILELGGVEGVPAGTGSRALAWVERAAARAEAEELWPAVAGLLDQALRLAVFGESSDRDRLVLARARARVGLRDVEGAAEDLAEALEAAERRGDRRTHMRALIVSGELERVEGRVEVSSATLHRAVELARQLGDEQGAADALRALGQTRLFAGDEAGADTASIEALAAFRHLGDRRGEAWALQSLAWTAFLRRDFGPAEDRLRASAAAFSEIGDWGGRAWATGLLAWVRFSQGRLEEAEQLGQAVLREAVEGGDRWAIGMMTLLLANVSLWWGRTTAAVEAAADARHAFVELKDRWGEAQALIPLTRGVLALGDIARGRVLLDDLAEAGAQVADRRMGQAAEGSAANAAAQQLGEGASVRERVEEMLASQPDLVPPEQRGLLGLIQLQAGEVGDAVTGLEAAVEGCGGPAATPNIAGTLALGLLAAGRVEEASAVLGQCSGLGTYHDQAWTAIGRGFVARHRGDPAGVTTAFDEAMAVVDATEDRLAQATVRLARAVALEAVGDAAAPAAAAEARERLGNLGVELAGWVRVFRLAVGPEPVRDRPVPATT